MTHSCPEPSGITALNSFMTGHSFEDPSAMVINDGFNWSKTLAVSKGGLQKGLSS